MDSNGKWKRNSLLAVGVVLIIISGIVIIQPKPVLVKEATGSYLLNTEIGLTDRLKNNSLYGNNTTLENPSVIYNNITDNMSTIFFMQYSDTNLSETTIGYTYSVFIESSSPSWQYLSYTRTGSLKMNSGNTVYIESSINVSRNLSDARKINGQLGIISPGAYSLYFVLTVTSRIGTDQTNMTLALGNPTDSLSRPQDTPLTGSYFKNVVDPGRIVIPLNIEYSYIILAAGAVATGISLAMIISSAPRKSYTEKFKEENRDNVIVLKSGPPENAIEVNSTDDIMRMATFIERPIFLNGNIIFIEMDGKVYFAEIRK